MVVVLVNALACVLVMVGSQARNFTALVAGTWTPDVGHTHPFPAGCMMPQVLYIQIQIHNRRSSVDPACWGKERAPVV